MRIWNCGDFLLWDCCFSLRDLVRKSTQNGFYKVQLNSILLQSTLIMALMVVDKSCNTKTHTVVVLLFSHSRVSFMMASCVWTQKIGFWKRFQVESRLGLRQFWDKSTDKFWTFLLKIRAALLLSGTCNGQLLLCFLGILEFEMMNWSKKILGFRRRVCSSSWIASKCTTALFLIHANLSFLVVEHI